MILSPHVSAPRLEPLPVGSLGIEFCHLGLAVRYPERARRFLSLLGYEIGAATYDPVEDVQLALARHRSNLPTIELVAPGPSSRLWDELLDGRNECVCHLGYETTCLQGTLDQLEAHGMHVATIAPPHPVVALNSRRVSLHQITGFGLIELIEVDPPVRPEADADTVNPMR